MLAAAADVTGIGSAINDAKAAAAGPTTGVLEAAADEVSASAAAWFNSYAREYQALVKQAGRFHDEFARLLATAGTAYAGTEAGASKALAAPLTGGEPRPVGISLIMTPTDIPIPSPKYLSEVYHLYISPNFTTTNIHGLTTPEQLFPITGLRSMTLDQSVRQGLTILNNAIFQAYDSGITPINVFGYSQSAVIASLEMQKLIAAGIPSTDVNFVLVGDPMNPNGGMFTRFPGLGLPHLGGMYSARYPGERPTQPSSTRGEYDGFADFPRYPIDVFADLNAVWASSTCTTSIRRSRKHSSRRPSNCRRRDRR